MLAAMKLLIFDMISIGRLRRTCRPVGLEAQPGWLVGWSVAGGVVCCGGWCDRTNQRMAVQQGQGLREHPGDATVIWVRLLVARPTKLPPKVRQEKAFDPLDPQQARHRAAAVRVCLLQGLRNSGFCVPL